MSDYPSPNNFLLHTIRTNRYASPKEIYNIFYSEIQRREIETMERLKFVFDLIETKKKKINVVSNNLEEIERIKYTLQILSEMETDIRNEALKPGKFLKDLDNLLKFSFRK